MEGIQNLGGKVCNQFEMDTEEKSSESIDEHLRKTAESILMKQYGRQGTSSGNGVPIVDTSAAKPLQNYRSENAVMQTNYSQPQKSPIYSERNQSTSYSIHKSESISPERGTFSSKSHSGSESPKIRQNQMPKESYGEELKQFPRSNSPQKLSALKQKGPFLAEDEINQLKMEITNERDLRLGKVFFP